MTAAFPPPDRATMIHDRFAAPLVAGPLVVGHVGASGGGAASISGGPSTEEVVAVMAALEYLWPKPVLVLPATTARTTPPWRFSGRWWVRPVAARRDRPYT